MERYWTVRLTGVTNFAALKAAILKRYPQARVRPLEREADGAGVILPQEYWINSGDNSDSGFFNQLRHEDYFLEYDANRVEE